MVLLGVCDGQMDGSGGLALSGRGASDHERLEAAVETTQQDGVAEGTDGLLEPGYSVFSALRFGAIHGYQSSRASFARAGRAQATTPRLDHRQAARHLGLEEAGDLFGVADGFVEYVAHDGGAHCQQSGEQERQHYVEPYVGEYRPDGSAGGIGNADGAVLESCVDAGFLDFTDQFFIERLVGLSFMLERLVLEAARVEAVKLGLGFGDGLIQHGLAVDGLAVFDFDALRGVLA